MNILSKLTIVMAVIGALFISFSPLALPVAPQDSQVTVQWQEPENYTDILSGDQSRLYYQKRVFANFEKYFAKLSRRLPQGYQWNIKVTDIDLAGDINNAYSQGHRKIRVIGRLFKTKVAFSYQLRDAQGRVVAEADEVLKENMIERFPRIAVKQGSFAYEKYMIKQWFNKVLMVQVKPT